MGPYVLRRSVLPPGRVVRLPQQQRWIAVEVRGRGSDSVVSDNVIEGEAGVREGEGSPGFSPKKPVGWWL